MVKCPRCEQPVDETVRTTCPLCFTPLALDATANAPQPPVSTPPPPSAPVFDMPPPAPPSAAPMPGGYAPPTPPPTASPTLMGGPAMAPTPPPQPMPPPAPMPGQRVSLTGEVISDSGSSTPPPSYVGAPLPPMSGPRPPASPSAPRRVTEAPARSGKNSAGAVVAVLLVCALAAFGGWWFMMHRTNPKDQARKFLTAVKALDYKALYELTELSEEDKKDVPDAAAFEAKTKEQMSKVPGSEEFLKSLVSNMEIVSISEPTYADGGATVTAELKNSILGMSQTTKQTMNMKNVNGIWKVDGTSAKGFGTLGSGGLTGGGGRRR